MTAPPKLSRRRYRVAVADAGTVRQAAQALCLSRSSVTKRRQQIEDALGRPLLQRSNPANTAAGAQAPAHTGLPDGNLAVIHRAWHGLSAVCGAFLDALRGVARQSLAACAGSG